MITEIPTKLTYVEDRIGFSIAQVNYPISDYGAFVETISKDKRIPVNKDLSPNRTWLPGLEHIEQRKVGIAKNAIYGIKVNGTVRPSKDYDWAFQFKSQDPNAILSGLYRQSRPMFAFEGDYNFIDAPFLLMAIGIDIKSEDLERTIDRFFASTGLNPKPFSDQEIEEFDAKKDDVIWSIKQTRQRVLRFRDFTRSLGYELLQGNELYDRFVEPSDFG